MTLRIGADEVARRRRRELAGGAPVQAVKLTARRRHSSARGGSRWRMPRPRVWLPVCSTRGSRIPTSTPCPPRNVAELTVVIPVHGSARRAGASPVARTARACACWSSTTARPSRRHPPCARWLTGRRRRSLRLDENQAPARRASQSRPRTGRDPVRGALGSDPDVIVTTEALEHLLWHFADPGPRGRWGPASGRHPGRRHVDHPLRERAVLGRFGPLARPRASPLAGRLDVEHVASSAAARPFASGFTASTACASRRGRRPRGGGSPSRAGACATNPPWRWLTSIAVGSGRGSRASCSTAPAPPTSPTGIPMRSRRRSCGPWSAAVAVSLRVPTVVVGARGRSGTAVAAWRLARRLGLAERRPYAALARLAAGAASSGP